MSRIIAVLGLLILAACGPIYGVEETYVPPDTQQGKMCVNRCLEVRQDCKKDCRSEERSCRQIEDLRSENEYLRYLDERRRTGSPIEKERHHFTSYSSCDTGYCTGECEDDYRMCYTNCGGTVLENRICTAFCE